MSFFERDCILSNNRESYSEVYQALIEFLENYLKKNKAKLPKIDERSLNQAISKFYDISQYKMLLAKNLNIYISPTTNSNIQ